MTNVSIEKRIELEELNDFVETAVKLVRLTGYDADGSEVHWKSKEATIRAFHPEEIMLTKRDNEGKRTALIRGSAFNSYGVTTNAYVSVTEGFNGFDEADVRHAVKRGYTSFSEAYEAWGE